MVDYLQSKEEYRRRRKEKQRKIGGRDKGKEERRIDKGERRKVRQRGREEREKQDRGRKTDITVKYYSTLTSYKTKDKYHTVLCIYQ